MLIDLKSSTSIAEELGHLLHSQLIQDCFADLNRVLDQWDSEVIQYVGDEAILTWKMGEGLKENRCIDVFFAFEEQLLSREAYYQEKYGLCPQFKAGVHGGKVMVAEVGTSKKQIAYHGDVINTAARIQSKCNEYGQTFIISKELYERIEDQSKYQEEQLGIVPLKGKKELKPMLGLRRGLQSTLLVRVKET